MTLEIVGWSEHFENNRSREYKHLRWVPVPNKHDGEGFSTLMHDEHGLEDFACWILIVQIASKCKPRNGRLARDDGSALTPRAMSLKTQAPAHAFERAIPRLIEIGWLVDDEPEIPQAAAEIPQASRSSLPRTELNRTEEKRTERKESSASASPQRDDGYPVWFEALWKQYPRKIGKKAAYACCQTRIKQGASENELMMAAANYAQAVLGREMAHIKHATTFYGPKDWWYDYRESVPDGDSTSSQSASSDDLRDAFSDAPWNKEPDDD